MKKILIAITDAGNAHRVAAEAIRETFKTLYPNQYEIDIVDMLKEADVEPFNTSDISYSLFSQNTFLDGLHVGLSRLLNTSIAFDLFKSYVIGRLKEPFKEIIKERDPDIVICNHPVPTIVLSEIKKEEGTFKYVVTVLDLITFFRPLADLNADLITAPTEEIASKIATYGVPINKIYYPMFPFHPRLRKTRSKNAVAKELGIDAKKPIILITGGGLGLKTMKSGILQLASNSNLQLLIVAGKLKSFREELEEIYSTRSNIKVFGYVNNMQDYINAADIVIAKPGATTIMECDLLNKKAIFTKRVGHVEMGHDQYIKNNPRFRYIGNDWNSLPGLVEELLSFDQSNNLTTRNISESEDIVRKITSII